MKYIMQGWGTTETYQAIKQWKNTIYQDNHKHSLA